MDTFMTIATSGVTGALLVWLFRNWISERLKQSIQHEYSQKLENHKAELNTRIQAIQHENQLQQLKTSLFFDHQRNAFVGILAKIAEVNRTWIDKTYVYEEGLTGPAPDTEYKELQALYYQHQLFLDSSCLAAMDLIFDCYSDSFPYDDGSGSPSHVNYQKIDAAYHAIEYLQPRLAELFQSRIGVTASEYAERDIALLGAIRLLNRYQFAEINLPVEGALKLSNRDNAADSVARAEENFEDLIAKLRQFQIFLKREHGFFHEAAKKTAWYLAMLVGPQKGQL
jgi:hypothetical protein